MYRSTWKSDALAGCDSTRRSTYTLAVLLAPVVSGHASDIICTLRVALTGTSIICDRQPTSPASGTPLTRSGWSVSWPMPLWGFAASRRSRDSDRLIVRVNRTCSQRTGYPLCAPSGAGSESRLPERRAASRCHRRPVSQTGDELRRRYCRDGRPLTTGTPRVSRPIIIFFNNLPQPADHYVIQMPTFDNER